jgi:hypothetical protein
MGLHVNNKLPTNHKIVTSERQYINKKTGKKHVNNCPRGAKY